MTTLEKMGLKLLLAIGRFLIKSIPDAAGISNAIYDLERELKA